MTEDSPLFTKTRELCQTILDQPEVKSIHERINAFLGDETARSQYESLVNKGQELRQKQEGSLPLSGEEIADFEQDRDALLKNPVARGFIDAQEELHEMKHAIQKHLSKTLELGRLPTSEDLEEGGCCSSGGGGCGCSH
jgi:cell fate (sporulation/competence/biofilm development) regulator YlbF (YheA/YmcA/DUF963 family)